MVYREGSGKTFDMKFFLFSKIEFEIENPLALIECYCFQSDFYKHYDLLLPDRKLEAVSKIGARIPNKLLQKCKEVIENKASLPIFKYDDNLDKFLDLDGEAIDNQVRELSTVIRELMDIGGIGPPRATKILHTRYPGIIPMIDSMLQKEYKGIKPKWKKDNLSQILIDYYKNLKKDTNRRHLSCVFDAVSKNLPCLTKVRVFDILWWSYLKAKTMQEDAKKEGISINFSTIRKVERS